MVLSEARVARPAVVLCTVLVAGTMLWPAGVPATLSMMPSEELCGPYHRTEVRQVMVARNPNARGPGLDAESALRFNRGVIIRDFLRLRAERGTVVPQPVRDLDADRLRSVGDGGRLSAEACLVVRFMNGYYGDADPAPDAARFYLRGDESTGLLVDAAPQSTPNVVVAMAAPPPPPPTPVPAPAVALAPRPAVVRRLVGSEPPMVPAPRPEPPALPAVEAAPELAVPGRQSAIDGVEVDARTARVAQGVIEELEAQLRVAPYLSFREARMAAGRLSEDELREQRVASLRASERVLSLLETLDRDPRLRDAVQSSLGSEGRARVEEHLLRAFRSLPDAEHRERALRTWDELESAARERP